MTTTYGELEAIGLADNPPMVMTDPPEHTAFRRLVSRGFTPRQVESLEPTVREFVVERLEALRADGGGTALLALAQNSAAQIFTQPQVRGKAQAGIPGDGAAAAVVSLDGAGSPVPQSLWSMSRRPPPS